METFPGNSHTSKIARETSSQTPVEETPSEKSKKVIAGKVVRRKRPLGAQFKEMFASDGGFVEHLVATIVVPMTKEIILTVIAQTTDGFRRGFEDMLFKDSDQRPTRTTSYGTGRPVVNYSRYSSGSSPVGRAAYSGTSPRTIRRSNVIERIILETRDDCQLVLDELKGMIQSIGHCTVGDLYNNVGIRPKSTDESWGWDDLSDARIRHLTRDEFELMMPRPVAIENE